MFYLQIPFHEVYVRQNFGVLIIFEIFYSTNIIEAIVDIIMSNCRDIGFEWLLTLYLFLFYQFRSILKYLTNELPVDLQLYNSLLDSYFSFIFYSSL